MFIHGSYQPVVLKRMTQHNHITESPYSTKHMCDTHTISVEDILVRADIWPRERQNEIIKLFKKDLSAEQKDTVVQFCIRHIKQSLWPQEDLISLHALLFKYWDQYTSHVQCRITPHVIEYYDIPPKHITSMYYYIKRHFKRSDNAYMVSIDAAQGRGSSYSQFQDDTGRHRSLGFYKMYVNTWLLINDTIEAFKHRIKNIEFDKTEMLRRYEYVQCAIEKSDRTTQSVPFTSKFELFERQIHATIFHDFVNHMVSPYLPIDAPYKIPTRPSLALPTASYNLNCLLYTSPSPRD